MKNTNLFRISALILAAIMLCTVLCSCGGVAKARTAMSYEGYAVTDYMYEYWQRQFKSYFLYVYGGEDTVEYLGTKLGEDYGNKTIGEFFTEQINDIAKTYLAGWYLFDEVYKLTLPESITASIDEMIESDIANAGDRASLNKTLSEMNMNIDRLRQVYEIEEKVAYVYAYLYGDASMGIVGVEPITDDDLGKYFTEKYVAIEHILINTTVEYVLDDEGNYTYDSAGNYEYVELDETETAKKEALADDVWQKLQDGADFAQLKAQYNDDVDAKNYQKGYFIAADSGYPQNFTKAAMEMEIGEMRMVSESYGRHIMRRIELDPEGYKDEAYTSSVLSNFAEYVTSYVYTQKIQHILDAISIDAEILEEYPIMPTEAK